MPGPATAFWAFFLLTASSRAEGDGLAMPDAAAKGQLLYQTHLKPLRAATPQAPQPLSDIPDDDLLSTSDGLVMEPVPAKEEPPLQGAALLRADLLWLWAALADGGVAPFANWLRAFPHWGVQWTTLLAIITACASFALSRSLLRDHGPAPEPAKRCEVKVSEDDLIADLFPEEQREQLRGAGPVAAMRPMMDATNPVLIQRANEHQEEAAKRAVQIKNAQRDHRDVFGCTALHMAAHNCHPEDVEQLLAAGFEVNAQDHFGETALHMAARSGCRETVSVLLAHSADRSRRNSFGKTPAAVAALHDPRLAALLRAA